MRMLLPAQGNPWRQQYAPEEVNKVQSGNGKMLVQSTRIKVFPGAGCMFQGGNTKRLDSADLSDFHHSSTRARVVSKGNFAPTQVHLRNWLILLMA